ncbi:MAG: hypothetical protein DWI25_01550 [Planctomycetota bacterium]|nr:MAG: hypothetical protein DWI25_01550 [Planctomycetota bacterium]
MILREKIGCADCRLCWQVAVSDQYLETSDWLIAIKIENIFGGDDLRERKSTTLVVAWMSPLFTLFLSFCDAGFAFWIRSTCKIE